MNLILKSQDFQPPLIKSPSDLKTYDPDLNKTITFQSGMETSYNIRKNKSGGYTVRFMNQVAIDVLAHSLKIRL